MTASLSSPKVAVPGRRLRAPWGILGVLLACGALAGGYVAWRGNTVRLVDGLPLLPRVARLKGLADFPVYPNAQLDPAAMAVLRGPVQTAIYLTPDTLEDVKAYYVRKLGLPDEAIRELSETWVTDLPKADGQRFTIQVERQAGGSRVSLIYTEPQPL